MKSSQVIVNQNKKADFPQGSTLLSLWEVGFFISGGYVDKEVLDGIGIDVEGDLIFITVAKYKLFLSYGKIGMDAYLLYSHLMFTARLQRTNSIKANNVYLRQGLKWGKEKLQKAKNLLTDLSLIESFPRIDDETKQIKGWYIRVKTKTTPFEIEHIGKERTKASDPESQTVGEPEGGFQDTNALTKNINALTKNINTLDLLIFRNWNKKEKLPLHNFKTIRRNMTKKRYKIIKEIGFKETCKAIDNYYNVLINDKQYYSHKFTFWRFIDKIDEFRDEALPWENWIDSKYQDETEDHSEMIRRICDGQS